MPTATVPARRRTRELQSLTGLSAIEAIARVRRLELRPAVEPCDAAPDDHGLVLAQDPPAGSEAGRGQLVTLLVGECSPTSEPRWVESSVPGELVAAPRPLAPDPVRPAERPLRERSPEPSDPSQPGPVRPTVLDAAPALVTLPAAEPEPQPELPPHPAERDQPSPTAAPHQTLRRRARRRRMAIAAAGLVAVAVSVAAGAALPQTAGSPSPGIAGKTTRPAQRAGGRADRAHDRKPAGLKKLGARPPSAARAAVSAPAPARSRATVANPGPAAPSAAPPGPATASLSSAPPASPIGPAPGPPPSQTGGTP